MLNSQRDVRSKRREIQIAALKNLYLKLSNVSQRKTFTEDMKKDIESLVSEIQLYGNKKLTELTGELVERFKKNEGWISFDELQKELRDLIRKDLGLPKLGNEVWWIRFQRESESK